MILDLSTEVSELKRVGRNGALIPSLSVVVMNCTSLPAADHDEIPPSAYFEGMDVDKQVSVYISVCF